MRTFLLNSFIILITLAPALTFGQKTFQVGLKLGIGEAKYWGVEGFSQVGVMGGVAFPIRLDKGFTFQPEVLFSMRGGERLTRVDTLPAVYNANVTDRIDTLARVYNKDNIGCIQIPLLFRIDLLRREEGEEGIMPYILAGPWVGFNVLKSAKTTTYLSELRFGDQPDLDFRTDREVQKITTDGKVDNMRLLSLGLVLAAGFRIPAGEHEITFEGRYDLDFNSLFNGTQVNYVGKTGVVTQPPSSYIRTRMLSVQAGFNF